MACEVEKINPKQPVSDGSRLNMSLALVQKSLILVMSFAQIVLPAAARNTVSIAYATLAEGSRWTVGMNRTSYSSIGVQAAWNLRLNLPVADLDHRTDVLPSIEGNFSCVATGWNLHGGNLGGSHGLMSYFDAKALPSLQQGQPSPRVGLAGARSSEGQRSYDGLMAQIELAPYGVTIIPFGCVPIGIGQGISGCGVVVFMREVTIGACFLARPFEQPLGWDIDLTTFPPGRLWLLQMRYSSPTIILPGFSLLFGSNFVHGLAARRGSSAAVATSAHIKLGSLTCELSRQDVPLTPLDIATKVARTTSQPIHWIRSIRFRSDVSSFAASWGLEQTLWRRSPYAGEGQARRDTFKADLTWNLGPSKLMCTVSHSVSWDVHLRRGESFEALLSLQVPVAGKAFDTACSIEFTQSALTACTVKFGYPCGTAGRMTVEFGLKKKRWEAAVVFYLSGDERSVTVDSDRSVHAQFTIDR